METPEIRLRLTAAGTDAALAALGVLVYKLSWQRDVTLAVTSEEGARSVRLHVDGQLRARDLVEQAARDAAAAPDATPDVTVAIGSCANEMTLDCDARMFPWAGEHLDRTLEAIVADPERLVSEIDPVGDGERAELGRAFNETARDYPRDVSIQRLFEQQTEERPDAMAVICGASTLTYRQLNAAANRLASRLRELGVDAEDRVGLIVPRGVETVVGVLAILKAGGAYVPVDEFNPDERVRYLLDDSGARVLVTSRLAGRPHFDRAVATIDDDVMSGREAAPDPPIESAPTDLAYVMYTSGTTGRPKGVLVTHRNVVRLVKNTDYVSLSASTRILQTGAIGFDASTFEIWGALLNGGVLCLEESDRLLDAGELARLMSDHRITTMWLTAPLFNRLVDQDCSVFAPLDELLVGGDALSVAHVSRALEASPGLRLVNGYGPTENTTFSTTHAVGGPGPGPIPIGRPIANSTAYLLGPDDQLVPVGAVGELCVGGDGLARGYLNRPELTARAFIPSPFDPTQRLYRTGDLARRRPDGTLEFLGRRDDQVKVRGFRIEPGEIEAALLAHTAVREAVVVARARPHGADKVLCAYYATSEVVEPGALRAELADALPDHMVPAFLVELPALPLNGNGKVDRAALPEPTGAVTAPVAARTDAEQRLLDIVERSLRIRDIGVARDLRDVGVDSLSATVLAAEIERVAGVRLPVSEILQAGTVEALARRVEDAPRVAPGHAPCRVDGDATAPVTSQQWRLFVDQVKDPGATHYNIPVAVDLPGDTDVPRLVDALGRLAERHEVLRTGFDFVDGEVRQRVAPSVPYEIAVHGAEPPPLRAFVRPFDLTRAPLWRAAIAPGPERVRLMLDLHHIVIDGFSLAVLFEELFELYDGVALPDVTLQYRDYAEWAVRGAGAERRRAQRDHWTGVFGNPLADAELPLDFPRSATRRRDGGVVEFRLDADSAHALRRLARREGAGLFAALVAIHAAVLARVTGAPEVVAGTPVSGRDVPGVDRALGMFANTVCLRTPVDPEQPFGELVRAVSRTVSEAAQHADYPFENLVEDVGARRHPGRNPLFDALIALQSNRYLDIDFRGRRRLELDWTGPTPFDLNLQIHELGHSLRFGWQFATALFRRETVEALRDLFLHATRGVLAHPHAPVGRLTGVRRSAPSIQFHI
jgi:amino acid adenylation domain-containing protein